MRRSAARAIPRSIDRPAAGVLPDATRMRALKLTVRLVLSLCVSALLMWLSLRNADLRAVGRAIADADPWRMAGFAAILLCIHLVRTVRWGILLEPLGHVPPARRPHPRAAAHDGAVPLAGQTSEHQP